MAELSNSELLILDNLLGFDIEFAQNDSVTELLNVIDKNKENLTSRTMSLVEIEDFLTSARNSVSKNPTFGEYVVYDVSPRIKDEAAPDEAAPIVTFANGEDAVVTFWGTTGEKEWYDNVKAAGNYFTTDASDPEKGSVYQEAASAYIKKISERYDNITVTGHSKGGNKAQYVALMCPEVDRCVSFDGQGFSADFIAEYAELIAQRKDIITSISAEHDIVNALLPEIAGTILYVDTSSVPEEYLSNFFYYHKPNILLDSNGELYNTDGVQPSKLATFVNEYTTYMSQIENDAHRELAIELLANIASDAMGKNDIDSALNRVLEFENAEAMSAFIAYTFEFAEESDLSYQDVLDIVSSITDDSSKLDNWYMPLLWDALFDASEQISVNEFMSLCTQVSEWGQSNGLSSWDELVSYICDDPVRIIELYSSPDLENDTVNKAVGNFASEENISKLIGNFITEHPIITSLGVSALSMPIVIEQIAMLASVVAAIGVVALTANHVVKNWDRISDALEQAAEYVKDEIVEFYNEAKQAVKSEINNWISSVTSKAEKYITKGSRVVNKIVDGATDFWEFFKEQAIASVKNLLFVSNPLFYIIASKVYREVKEPVKINVYGISDCVDRMNRLAKRVAKIDQRLDDLYWRLAQNNIEQDEGLFTSLANIYNLFRADLNVDEGATIKRKARALTDLYDGYKSTDEWVLEHVPKKI